MLAHQDLTLAVLTGLRRRKCFGENLLNIIFSYSQSFSLFSLSINAGLLGLQFGGQCEIAEFGFYRVSADDNGSGLPLEAPPFPCLTV